MKEHQKKRKLQIEKDQRTVRDIINALGTKRLEELQLRDFPLIVDYVYAVLNLKDADEEKQEKDNNE